MKNSNKDWILTISAFIFLVLSYIGFSSSSLIYDLLGGSLTQVPAQIGLILERAIVALVVSLAVGIPFGFLLSGRIKFFSLTVAAATFLFLIGQHMIIINELPPWTQYVEGLILAVIFNLSTLVGSKIRD